MKLGKTAASVAMVGAFGTLSACLEETGGASVSTSPGGGVPAFSASCPNFIEANSDGSGVVYINAQIAAVTKFSETFYEAVLGDVKVSISQADDGTVSATYNKTGVGNGVCTMNAL